MIVRLTIQTHPQRMVGSVLHRHDNVHRQLAAFTELLRRVQSHYANDQLHQMLCAVCVAATETAPRRGQEKNQRTTHDEHEGNHHDVTSVSQLRGLVDRLRHGGARRSETQRNELTAIVSYFDRFFDDLDRLRDLKRYFHERIYACLHEHYYRPDNDNAVSATSTDNPDSHGGIGRPLATVLDQSDNDVPSNLDGRPLSDVVHQLWTLNRDWDIALSEEDNGVVEIDDGPRVDEERFAKISCIVPNWVEFGFRALQLAKVWWTTANRIYGGKSPAGGKQTVRNEGETVQPPYGDEENEEDDDVVSSLEEIATLNDCAYQTAVELDKLREELRQIRRHGARVESLYKKLKEAQSEELVAKKHHGELLAQSKSPDHDSTDVSLLRQLDRAAVELEVAQYRVNLIQGDLEVESGIQYGSGVHGAPLENELQALEEQLEKTLSAKQTAEDRLKNLTAGSSESGGLQRRSDAVNTSSTDDTAAGKYNTAKNRQARPIQRV